MAESWRVSLILKIENVCKAYYRAGGHVDALINVSLEVARGDFIGILGPSGAGKSTLLRLAAGFELPDSGSVSFEGRVLGEMSKAETALYRRREVGCVWGSRYLNNGLCVLDNVVLPSLFDGCDHRTAERRAIETLIAVRADHTARARPDELSDGERQRVLIAQALVTKPQILLADEPASNLDLIEQDSLLALLQSFANDSKMAVLIADTDASALMRSKPILYLRDGQLRSKRAPVSMGKLIEMPKYKRGNEGPTGA